MKPKRILARFRRLVDYGCVCCKQLGFYSVPEIHHVLSGGRRMGDDFVLPLCPMHHRGVKPHTIVPVGFDMGPSLSAGSKPFEARWGTQRELLERVNAAISEVSA